MSDRKDPDLQLLDACYRGELLLVRELIKSKVIDPNRVVDRRYFHNVTISGLLYYTNGWTPLHYATVQGHLEVVKFLLTNSEPDVNAKDRMHGMTPLQYACLWGKLEVVKYLVNNSNANINVKDKWDRSPLDLARHVYRNRQIAEVLIEHDAKHSEESATAYECTECEKKFTFYRRQYNCCRCLAPVCDNCSKHKVPISDLSSKPERVCNLCFDVLSARCKNESSVSVSVDDEEEELSVEELPSEDKTDHPSQPGKGLVKTGAYKLALKDMPPPLTKATKDGYKCKAQTSPCLVYLPQEINEKLSIETVTDTSIHPKIASNEILITPVVRIISDNTSLSLEKPAVIELAKTIELSDKEANNKVIPLCANSESSEWKELGSDCNCKVLKDRISFQVTHFSLYYAVLSRKPYPLSTVRVKPASSDTPAPEHSSAPTELTIPELPGFKVQIPPFSVNADRETDITATVLYDCPAMCSKDERCRLASSCIELEPHGITFSKAVSITIPIPDYAEVMKNDPNAQLQIFWHSTSCSTNEERNELVEHYILQDEEGRYVAIVQTDHFCDFRAIWKSTKAQFKRLFFKHTFNIKARCQVFMSQEKLVQSRLVFSISILFNPYKEEPYPAPHNYKHMLADSDLIDLKVSNSDTIQFGVEFDELLSPQICKPVAGLFALSGHQQKSFTIKLDGKVVLQEGLPMGELSIGAKEGSEENSHTLTLMKPLEQSSTSSSISTYQFEESITELEDAAERLDQDATQYDEASPGAMVEAAKKIASMWMKMAQLIRKECVLKERRFKEEIVDLAKGINRESQEVVRIATSTAEACTDRTMKHAVGGVVERIQMISHQLRILAAGEASRQRDEVSDLEACRLLTDNATNLTSTISQALYHTQSASLRVTKETRKKLGLTQMVETDPITGKHDKVRGDRSRERDHCQDSHEGSRGHIPSSSTKKRGHLSSSDLQKVQNSIWEARVQWYNLGLGLEITPDSLDAIKLDNAHKTEDCFRSMLTQWLRRDSPRPTWSALAESLRSPSVGLSHLAQEILAPE